MQAKNKKAFNDLGEASKIIVADLHALGNRGALFLPRTAGESLEAQFVRETLAILANVAVLQQGMLLILESVVEQVDRPRPAPRKRAPAKKET